MESAARRPSAMDVMGDHAESGRRMLPPQYVPARLVAKVTGSTRKRPRASTSYPSAAPASASVAPMAR